MYLGPTTRQLNSATKNYLLNGAADWDAFEHAYALKISAERVSHLGRLEDLSDFPTLRIQKPSCPEFSNYPVRLGTKVESQGTQSGTGNRTATLSSEALTATSYTELSRKDQEAYKVKVTLYRNNLDLFNKERWKEARACYLQVLKDTANGQKDWSNWITSWEKAIRVAQLCKVPETIYLSSWFKDTQQALDRHFNVFLRVKRGQNKDRIEAGTYKTLDFSSEFQEEIKKRKVPKAIALRVAKGSFAIAAGNATQENAKRSQSTTRESREGSAKKARPLIEGKAYYLGTIIYIFNNTKQFQAYKIAQYREGVFAGLKWLPILGFGKVALEVQGLRNKARILTLKGAAYYPQIGTNLMSLRKLHQAGY
ncbi:uncharacterized protein B0J16DRAFT_315403 [Fusarium flagelliforme]|uniref:uncharacterized protein n=1 Tax=Fusarium flagelliforme TaxID=2675880 RepID=UPI001E8CF5D2|nr:uncharacterized protein B0J16DRAFT_315403 [Fusarium flagelliforme]KAH7199132.1 hypothetical protein B0J16DRAFT_315403 [Fusarium flagelliforme]